MNGGGAARPGLKQGTASGEIRVGVARNAVVLLADPAHGVKADGSPVKGSAPHDTTLRPANLMRGGVDGSSAEGACLSAIAIVFGEIGT